MIQVLTVTAAHAMLLKATRLRALADTPSAFGSTHARESAWTDQDWIDRAAKWSDGTMSAGYLAMENAQPCGVAAGYFDVDDLHNANLVSMWVSPSHRRCGAGKLLVEAVVRWAQSRSAKSIKLMVVNNNAGAIRFYQSLGFEMTGRTEPYPNDVSLTEYEMARQIA